VKQAQLATLEQLVQQVNAALQVNEAIRVIQE
jgi:hypothetical protein